MFDKKKNIIIHLPNSKKKKLRENNKIINNINNRYLKTTYNLTLHVLN